MDEEHDILHETMDPQESALKLIGPIYDAAADASLWPEVLAQFAREAEGTTTGLLVHDVKARAGGNISVAVNIDPAFQRDYDTYYHSTNLHLQQLAKFAPRAVLAGNEIVADRAVLESEYYNDFLRRYDTFHIVGLFMALGAGQLGSISTFRPLRSGHFPESTLEMMRLLLPHFERAAKLHTKLGSLQAGFDSLDMLTSSVILVRPSGEVWQMNRSARELIGKHDGLGIVLGRLSAWNQEEKSKLQAAIQRACGAAMGNSLALDGRLVIHRQSGKRPLVLFVAPLRSSRLFHSGSAVGAVVFVNDPEREAPLSPSVLQLAYGLTRAQSRLAIAIARGHDLNEYCEQAGVRRTTARAHLRLIFDKLGVRRQAELAAAVLSTQGIVRPSEPLSP
jgi:DNA-binding CsgD family transcriptional regulator/PAS domain-containing protein